MTIDACGLERPARGAAHAAAFRSRAWAIVGALSVTQTVSWGVLYYAFAVLLVPMQHELEFSAAQLTGAFSVALLVSAIAGIAVGRYLDRRSPRGLMTAGSVAGVLLVLAWSQVSGLGAFYALWVAIGLTMATVLYEPAFTVLAKHFPRPADRRRALTALTLVAALASFIFLPLTQALIDAHGWRDALVILAAVLGTITVPLHALVLRPAPAPAGENDADRVDAHHPVAPDRSMSAGEALRSGPFWLLSVAFFLATFAAIAMIIHAIPFLLERGYSPVFAAFAVGLVGISQIPGRLLFAPLAAGLPRPAATAAAFVLIALGLGVFVSVHATPAVLAGLVLLGMGNGMTTLARATAIADLYGPGASGTIGSVAAFMTTTAAAAGPVAAALYAASLGYDALVWTLFALAAIAAGLAYRAEVAVAGSPRGPCRRS